MERTDDDESMHEARKQLGELLGLDRPVSEAVLLAALRHPNYAHNLMLSRQSDHLLSFLRNPNDPTLYSRASSSDLSTSELLSGFKKAMIRWTRTYFTKADVQTAARRLAACSNCEHLRAAPEQLVYRVATVFVSGDNRICDLCGCFVNKKVLIPTEACPDADPSMPEFSRWGDPIASDDQVC